MIEIEEDFEWILKYEMFIDKLYSESLRVIVYCATKYNPMFRIDIQNDTFLLVISAYGHVGHERKIILFYSISLF